MTTFSQDLSYAWRVLWKRPGFALVAIAATLRPSGESAKEPSMSSKARRSSDQALMEPAASTVMIRRRAPMTPPGGFSTSSRRIRRERP